MIKRLFSSTAFLLCLPVLTFTLTYAVLKRPEVVREFQNASLIEKDRARVNTLAISDDERSLIDLMYKETEQSFVMYPTLFVTQKERKDNRHNFNFEYKFLSSTAASIFDSKLFAQVCFVELYKGIPQSSRLKTLSHELGHCIASRHRVELFVLMREFTEKHQHELNQLLNDLATSFPDHKAIKSASIQQLLEFTLMRHYSEVMADVLGVYLAAKVRGIHPFIENQSLRRSYALKGVKTRDVFWYHSNWYFKKINQNIYGSISEVHQALLELFRTEHPLPPMMIVKESLIRQLKSAHQLDARFLVDDAHNKRVWAYLMAHYPEEYDPSRSIHVPN
ncbi:hypothetical protein L4D20_05755 [Vibrio kyushuensis]|uniref:hypothetical protein n=1 Tax=Vibrio kyushuensis TaxID=2910249 RepID=UPI003D0A876E